MHRASTGLQPEAAFQLHLQLSSTDGHAHVQPPLPRATPALMACIDRFTPHFFRVPPGNRTYSSDCVTRMGREQHRSRRSGTGHPFDASPPWRRAEPRRSYCIQCFFRVTMSMSFGWRYKWRHGPGWALTVKSFTLRATPKNRYSYGRWEGPLLRTLCTPGSSAMSMAAEKLPFPSLFSYHAIRPPM